MNVWHSGSYENNLNRKFAESEKVCFSSSDSGGHHPKVARKFDENLYFSNISMISALKTPWSLIFLTHSILLEDRFSMLNSTCPKVILVHFCQLFVHHPTLHCYEGCHVTHYYLYVPIAYQHSGCSTLIIDLVFCQRAKKIWNKFCIPKIINFDSRGNSEVFLGFL